MAKRQINKAGREIIKLAEGLKLIAYKCPAGVWTVGFGSTGPHVRQGLKITREQAELLLDKDLARFEDCVADAAEKPTDNQFSAMVSLAFNIGEDAFRRSTVLREHNDGNFELAAGAFSRWKMGGGKVLHGLVKRRAAEAQLYRI